METRLSPPGERAVDELLTFPNGLHDDFVDALSLIGLGLQSQFKPGAAKTQKAPEPKFGSVAWMRLNDKWAKDKAAERAVGGF